MKDLSEYKVYGLRFESITRPIKSGLATYVTRVQKYRVYCRLLLLSMGHAVPQLVETLRYKQ
jgi:hypothetical protein